MTFGRRASDWLKDDAAVPAGERRGTERRSTDRRAPGRRLDTLFAAHLINQVRPAADTLAGDPYAAARTVRAGLLMNTRV